MAETSDEHEHTPEAIRRRLSGRPTHSYLRDWVYGGIDGAVTTFAVVSGVVGGQLSSRIVLILGAANLIADGFSMAASNFSGTRAEAEELQRIRRIEERHVRVDPEGEREEVRQIYAAKGFEGEQLKGVVDVLTADRQRWVETMIAEEYGLPKTVRSPITAAAATFTAFAICGAVPLLPYVLGMSEAFVASSAMTVAVFFLIGSMKSLWSVLSWWRSGLETTLLGSAAAALSYVVAALLRSAFGSGP